MLRIHSDDVGISLQINGTTLNYQTGFWVELGMNISLVSSGLLGFGGARPAWWRTISWIRA